MMMLGIHRLMQAYHRHLRLKQVLSSKPLSEFKVSHSIDKNTLLHGQS
jgi:hypothetical protein